MAESDMTGSNSYSLSIDGTLLMRIILCRSRQKRRVRGPKQRSQALHLYRSFRAENRTQHSGSWIRRCSSVAGAQANIGSELLFQHLVSPEAIDAAMAYFAEHHIESYQWQVRTACTFPKVIAAIWSPRARRGIVVSLRGSGICWTR